MSHTGERMDLIKLLNWPLSLSRMLNLSRKRSWSVIPKIRKWTREDCFLHQRMDFRAILWWNQSGYWKVLLRRGGYTKSTGAGECGDFNLLGEFGYSTLCLEESHNVRGEGSSPNCWAGEGQDALHRQGGEGLSSSEWLHSYYSFVLLIPLFFLFFTKFTLKFLQTGVELELVESMALLEWIANSYKSFGASLEIITDKSQEGSQFVRGFGGIGGKFQ